MYKKCILITECIKRILNFKTLTLIILLSTFLIHLLSKVRADIMDNGVPYTLSFTNTSYTPNGKKTYISGMQMEFPLSPKHSLTFDYNFFGFTLIQQKLNYISYINDYTPFNLWWYYGIGGGTFHTPADSSKINVHTVFINLDFGGKWHIWQFNLFGNLDLSIDEQNVRLIPTAGVGCDMSIVSEVMKGMAMGAAIRPY